MKYLLPFFMLLISGIGIKSFGQNNNGPTNEFFRLYYSKNYDSALVIATNQAQLISSKVGAWNEYYASAIQSMALVYDKLNDFETADTIYKSSLQIIGKTLGINHDDYGRTLYFLANLNQRRGKYSNAELYLTQLIDFNLRKYGKNDLKYGDALQDMALLYVYEGIYEKAEPILLKALDIQVKNLPISKHSYEETLSLLGLICASTDKYLESERYFKNAILVDPSDTEIMVVSVARLSDLYIKTGRYDEAKNLLTVIESIAEKTGANLTQEHAQILVSLSEVEDLLGNFKSSIKYAQDACSEIIKYDERRDFGCYKYIERLGLEYLHNKNIEDAKSSFLIAADLFWESGNDTLAIFAPLLNQLGLVYLYSGELQKSENYFLQSINLTSKKVNPFHNNVRIAMHNLEQVFFNYSKFDSAIQIGSTVYDITAQTLSKNFITMNNYEQEEFVKNIFSSNNFDINQSLALIDRQASSLAMNSVILSKSLLLEFNRNISEQIWSSKDTELMRLYSEYIQVVKYIANEYTKTYADRNSDLVDYEQSANARQQEFMLKLNEFGFHNIIDQKSVFNITWRDIQAQLRSDEAVIEFGNFAYYNGGWSDSIYYCAYLIRLGDTMPQQLFLFEQKELDSLFIEKSPKVEADINRIYNFNSFNYGSNLYQLIWQKIEPYLKGISTVYYSPCGKLHKVAFTAIPISDSADLSDKYHLIQLNSTREIAFQKNKPLYIGDTSSITLFGGIRYDMDTTALKEATVAYHQDENAKSFVLVSRSYQSDSSSRGMTWKYLPGTLNEVEFIKSHFKQAKLFTGSQATEEAFKAQQGRQSPNVLHVATHGFFFKGSSIKDVRDGKSNEFEFSNDPLIRSGLIMAGGNLKWKGVNLPENLEDGILTAKEVAALNLSNTKLVVLSACETGLGDISGNEGVYGLQRAFKAAGVDYILMSLWTVPDEPTSEFMKTFYSKLKTGSDIQTAFEQTQAVMKQLYKDNPYNWAGFVLIR